MGSGLAMEGSIVNSPSGIWGGARPKSVESES